MKLKDGKLTLTLGGKKYDTKVDAEIETSPPAPERGGPREFGFGFALSHPTIAKMAARVLDPGEDVSSRREVSNPPPDGCEWQHQVTNPPICIGNLVSFAGYVDREVIRCTSTGGIVVRMRDGEREIPRYNIWRVKARAQHFFGYETVWQRNPNQVDAMRVAMRSGHTSGKTAQSAAEVAALPDAFEMKLYDPGTVRRISEQEAREMGLGWVMDGPKMQTIKLEPNGGRIESPPEEPIGEMDGTDDEVASLTLSARVYREGEGSNDPTTYWRACWIDFDEVTTPARRETVERILSLETRAERPEHAIHKLIEASSITAGDVLEHESGFGHWLAWSSPQPIRPCWLDEDMEFAIEVGQ